MTPRQPGLDIPRKAGRWRAAAVALVAFGAILLVPALGLATWTASETLMPSNVTSTSPVRVAYDGDGNAIAAYTRYIPFADELYVRERPPGGPWGPPQLVPLSPALGTYIRDLQLAVNDAGDVVIAFRSAGGVHALSRPAGGSWSTVTSWTSPGTNGAGTGCATEPSLDVGQDGTAVVAWSPANSCNGLVTYWRVVAAAFTPGVGWETTPQVWDTSATDHHSWPGVVVDDNGRATVAFGAQVNTLSGVYEEWTVDRSPSGVWGSPALLTASGGGRDDPTLDSRAGVTVVSWPGPGGTLAAVRNGSGWSSVQSLPFPGQPQNQPVSVAVDGTGTAYVAAAPVDGSVRRLHVASHPANGVWSTTPITPTTENALSPVIAANGAGDIVVAWTALVSGQFFGRAALRPAGGTWPAAAEPISPTPYTDDRIGASVAIDPFGHALVSTSPFTGFFVPGPAIIETRDPASAGGGSPPTVSPSSAQVGDTLTCSTGSFTGTPPLRYAYAWLRDGSPIPNATSASYETTGDDADASVGCRVTATNEGGSASADSSAIAVGSAGPGPDPCADAPTESPLDVESLVQLAVVNESTTTVELYWVDWSGNWVYYDTLTPGASVVKQTWDTNVWLAIDAGTGECLGWAEGLDGEFRIGGSGQPPPADTDGDGLYDTWETDGIDIDEDGTIDLPLHQAPYNADPDHKDLFLEVDYMAAYAPQAGTLGDVVAAFGNAPVSNPDGATGVRLHAMLGEQVPTYATVCFWDCPTYPAPISFKALKGGDPSAPCDGFLGSTGDRGSPNCASILDARRRVFRYAVFGANYSERPGSSGVAEPWGNDLMVTLGSAFSTWIAATGNLRAAEAGTLMHELGHTLNLGHGGSDQINCKPNYQSVMTYTRQVPNVDPARPLDYSREELEPLFESFLDETLGIDAAAGSTVIWGVGGIARVGPGNDEVDWNGDGSIDEEVSADVNRITTISDCPASAGQVLYGHDDWSALLYSFRGSSWAAEGASDAPPQPPAEVELTATVALETAKTVDSDGDGVPNASESICGLTRGYVQGSAKWQSSRPVQRAAATALVNTACKAIETIRPTTKPAVKKALVTAYKAAIDALRVAGWLTQAQATTLKGTADKM